MIIFSDPYDQIGGGQQVLEALLNHDSLAAQSVGLIMPRAGSIKLSFPASVKLFENKDEFLNWVGNGKNRRIVFVSNSNRGLISDRAIRRDLSRLEFNVSHVCIAHSYGGNGLRKAILKRLQDECDVLVPVEPGLAIHRTNGIDIPWLSVLDANIYSKKPAIPPTKIVKLYGRADRVKGFDLMPVVLKELCSRGYSCQIALSSSIDGDQAYERKIRRDLEPWLVAERKSSEWLNPGDIFLMPSRSETAALTVQEAVMRKAFVISSRVGIVPYLMSNSSSVSTLPPGSSKGWIDAVERLQYLPSTEAISRAEYSAKLVADRTYAFIDALACKLTQWDE